MEEIKTLYRYENHNFANFDPWDEDNYGVHVAVQVREYKVIRTTPKGFWISVYSLYNKADKWVSNDTRKRFAYPTKIEALEGFLRRKKRQIHIMKSRLSLVEDALRIGESMKLELQSPIETTLV